MKHEELFQKLVGTESYSPEGENNIAQMILATIKEQKYFREHPGLCGIDIIPDDLNEFRYPWALYLASPKTAATVLLTGHMDTVGIDNYELLKPFALSPDALRSQMESLHLSTQSEEDLASDVWIAGRGTADMKGGLSALMMEFFRLTEAQDIPVNVLLIPVPDEERYSAGARACIRRIYQLRKEYSLDIKLSLTAESHTRIDGKMVGSVGTVGKMQVNIVVSGEPKHIRFYYGGCSAAQLAANIITAIDGNPDLTERHKDQKTPPPVCMYMRDTKTTYDVTIPASVDMAFTCQLFQNSPETLIRKIKTKIEYVIEGFETRYRSDIDKWCDGVKVTFTPYDHHGKVITFAELLTLAKEADHDGFDKYYTELRKEVIDSNIRGVLSYNDATLKMIHGVLDFLSPSAPLVVIGLTPPFYPGFTNAIIIDDEHCVSKLPKEIQDFTKERFDVETRFEDYFPGISDMSYAATTYNQKEVGYLVENMPLWGDNYSIEFSKIKDLQIPVLNIGPWGKDIHTSQERVNRNSLFHENCEMIRFVLEKMK